MKQRLHFLKKLSVLFVFFGLMVEPGVGWGQYAVNFDGAADGTHASTYGFTNHNLNGITWSGVEVIIPTTPLAADWYNGVRSARLRGYSTSHMTMTSNKANGIGAISFNYRRYGTDAQVTWRVEYSTNDGGSWTQVGSDFTAPANDNIQVFSETVNVSGNARIRIIHVSGGASANRRLNIDDLLLTDYTGSSSTITVTPATLTGFTYIHGSGPSAEQSFTAEGSNLTANISIAPSTNYEISTGTGATFDANMDDPITLTQSGGTVATTTIYVRLKAGLSAGTYNGELITASSTGADNKTVACSGSVYAQYTWNQTGSADFNNSLNWTPNRNSPSTTDILVFNNGATTTATSIPTQSIGGLFVTSNTKLTLNSSSIETLTITNTLNGFDLYVENGSELNISQTSSNALSVNLGSDATGEIFGTMTLSSSVASTPNSINPTSANSLFFRNGSMLHQSTNSSSNIFGSTGTANAVIFESGSTFLQSAGANPFGLSQPNSRVLFNTGSMFKINGNITPAFNGRTYADFEFDFNSTVSPTASSSVSIDNLKITNGTFNFNVTGTPGHRIKGNVEVTSGALLSFSPSSAGTVNLNGSSTQTIFGSGAITAGSNSSLVIANASGVVLDNNASLNNLDIITGSLRLNSAKQLTVSGTLTNSGTLTIKSDATGTGSLIHSSSEVSATVERYVVGHANVAADGWHLMGSPVASFNITASSFQPGSTDDLFAWDEANNTWLNHLAGGPTQIVPGTGYLVAYENTAPKTFNGTLNVSDIPVSGLAHNASQGKGWHLLGNPFASALEWNKTGGSWALNNIAGTAKVWNSGTKAYVDVVANGIIPSAQGFFVQVNQSTTGSLTIPAAARAHSSTAWYKNTTPRLLLSASPADGSSRQESQIRIESEATSGFDFYFDSRFMAGYAPQFYSIAEGEMLSTNALPQLQDGTSIPFGFVKNQHNGFVIRLEESLPATDIYLKDLKLNLTHHLSQQTEYHFTAAQGDDPNRFLLQFGVVGLNEKPGLSAMQAYVAAGQLHVLNLSGAAQLEIYDLSGRLLQRRSIVADGTHTQPMALPAGVYVVRATTPQNSKAVKVIVQ